MIPLSERVFVSAKEYAAILRKHGRDAEAERKAAHKAYQRDQLMREIGRRCGTMTL